MTAPFPHPYSQRPERAFWRSAVAEVSALSIADVYRPRFPVLPEMRIVSAGSCFAQHLGRQFKTRGYAFVDLEPAPEMLDAAARTRFGFDLYSARYGNVYSARQLRQLFERADGTFSPRETAWQQEGRWYDPFRPAIEPGGFASREELERDVDWHLRRVAELLPLADLFVFTFGLTEAWLTRDGAVLPSCPGTVAGRFDAEHHHFHNFRFDEVLADAEAFIARALAARADMKFLFTVSPVPLTATATDQHVLPATVYSKSVLRAVCGTLVEKYPQVDYFPSYELVASHPMRGMLYEPNLRGVSQAGVDMVMQHFFAAHGGASAAPAVRDAPPPCTDADDLVCEEAILDTFGR